MTKLSPTTNKLLATMMVTLFIFLAFILSGFTASGLETQAGAAHVPALQLTNVIKNGDFETNPRASVATYWEPFNNGQAFYGWYADEWEEAVHSGEKSQLMEINFVDGFLRDRVIAIHQTVDVVPNANYNLTIHALMRSDAPIEDRNMGEYKMEWGIDYRGSGTHNNVLIWYTMPLSEQLRIGSNSLAPHDQEHLFFQRIFTTVHTADSSRITLFIRGVKIEPTGTEVNFNVDDVSLIGPYFPPPPEEEAASSSTTAAPSDSESAEVIPAVVTTDEDSTPASESAVPAKAETNLPDAGAILPQRRSLGAVLLGGLVLVGLGAGAVNTLLQNRHNNS